MKLTINEILLSTRALSQLSNADFPIGVAVKIAENLRTMNVVNEEYGKRQDKVAVKHGGIKTKDGMQYQIPDDKIAAFNKEVQKISEEEIDIDLQQCTIAELGSDLRCSPNALVHLKWLFSDYNNQPKALSDVAGNAA